MKTYTSDEVDRMLASCKRQGVERAAAFVLAGAIPLGLLAAFFGEDVSAATAVVTVAGYCCMLCAVAEATL